nr:isocitrate lyase/phosphoenolpyruvate mutase family protein [Rhodococcus sp. MS13]
MHHRASPLILPNAWDIPSALAFLDAGFEAIGTTSFGVASTQGAPDGLRATRAANIALARDLAHLPCHISIDIEDGYTEDLDDVADYVAELGVAGINIEDSTAGKLVEPNLLAAKVAAIKRKCPRVFVNARVDTYWVGQEANIETTIRRAEQYVAAGADGIFVPGATDSTVLRDIATAVTAPLNILPVPGLSLTELATIGIRRVSTGSLPYRAAVTAAVSAAEAVRSGFPAPDAISYKNMQERLIRHVRSKGPH